MLTELTAWWLRQLRELLPLRWRPRDAGPRHALVIDYDITAERPAATCLRRRRGREVPIAHLALAADDAEVCASPRPGRREPVVLRLAATPLQREVVLPLAAEAGAERFLQVEMDRLTPFPTQELFWSWQVTQRDPARGQLHLMLSLVPRAALAPLLAALERHGLVPELLEAVLPDATVRRIALQAAHRRRLLPLLAAGGMVAAVVGVVALPFVLQDREAAALRRQIDALKPRTERVEALRRRAAVHEVDPTTLRAELRRVGDAMQVLASLTDLLPDDTFVTAITMRQRRLTLTGQSADAARLIALLSAGSLFQGPAFAAPVVRDPTGATDTFSLHAEIAPEVAPKIRR
jgi:general secretion pathway protein L